jgi:hypothetical protein
MSDYKLDAYYFFYSGIRWHWEDDSCIALAWLIHFGLLYTIRDIPSIAFMFVFATG